MLTRGDIEVMTRSHDGQYMDQDDLDRLWTAIEADRSELMKNHKYFGGPQAYRTAQQLEAEYLAEHREKIERDASTVFSELADNAEGITVDHLLYDALFNRALLEKHLAAERARIEGEGK